MLSTQTLEQRLLKAVNPRILKNWNSQDSYYTTQCQITVEDVPELFRIMNYWIDPDWPYPPTDPGVEEERHVLMPVTAWRALSELRSEDLLPKLIDFLVVASNNLDDDWVACDMPWVFARIGPAAVVALEHIAKNKSYSEYCRLIAIESFDAMLKQNKSMRQEAGSALVNLMEMAHENTPVINAFIASFIANNQLIEGAEAVERAFASNLIEVGLVGDWETFRIELGVADLEGEMPNLPSNLPSWFNQSRENEPQISAVRVATAASTFDGGLSPEDGIAGYVEDRLHPLEQASQGRSSSKEDDLASRHTIRIDNGRIGRNDPCHCGSGKKFKKCCNA